MIPNNKQFQEGKLTTVKQPCCAFHQANDELRARTNKQALNNIKQGYRIFSLIQNNTYQAECKAIYTEKRNDILRDIYDKNKSNYLELVKAIIENTNKIQEIYCEFNMYLGTLQISRVSKPLLNKDIEVYLSTVIVPQLKKLNLYKVFANQYLQVKGLSSMEDYERWKDYYLRCLITENLDLHFFMQYVFDILDKITDSEFHCNSVFFSKDVCLLELEPFINIAALGTSYFYYKLRLDNKQYSKNNIPRLTLLNLDGYDHGLINFNVFGENQKNFQYISLFNDSITTKQDLITQMSTYQQSQSMNQTNMEEEFKDNFKSRRYGKSIIPGYEGDSVSVLDTFENLQDKETKMKDYSSRNSIYIPLQSHVLDYLTQNDSDEPYEKISSGKIRMIFTDYIYSAIRNFQPEIIIVSYSLAMNNCSHQRADAHYYQPTNNMSINHELFSQIMTNLQTYSNSKVMYCPHFLKNVHQKNYRQQSDSLSNDLSFDEKFYYHTMKHFSFSSKEQFENLYRYQLNNFGSFMQVQSGQQVEKNSKTYYYNNPISTLTKRKFNQRMNKYMRFIAENINPNLKQYITFNVRENLQLEIMNQISSLYANRIQEFNFKQMGMEQLKQISNNQEGKIKENEEKFLKFLKQIPYVYDSIHLIIKGSDSSSLIAKKVYFEVDKEQLFFSQISQYYVDYNQQCVYLFNISSNSSQLRHYLFSFKNDILPDSDGILRDYVQLPEFKFKNTQQEGRQQYQILQEFSVCTFQNYLFVIYGKLIKIDTSNIDKLEDLILLQEYNYEISDEIFILNVDDYDSGTQKMKQPWNKLKLETNHTNFPPKFMQTEHIGRLYASCIVTDKSTKKLTQPVLFIFGGVIQQKTQMERDTNKNKTNTNKENTDNNEKKEESEYEISNQLCNSIIRIAPLYNKSDNKMSNLANEVWYVSMMEKNSIVTIRPLCNSLAIEVKKNKILLIGGTHNKYLIPLQNNKICAYMFSIVKESASSQNTKSKVKQNQSKVQSQPSFEGGWELNTIEPEQFQHLKNLTNATLSNINNNLYKVELPKPYFIFLNEDKFENKKVYRKIQKYTDQNILQQYFNEIQIGKELPVVAQSNTTGSFNNQSYNSETNKEQQTYKKLKIQFEQKNQKIIMDYNNNELIQQGKEILYYNNSNSSNQVPKYISSTSTMNNAQVQSIASYASQQIQNTAVQKSNQINQYLTHGATTLGRQSQFNKMGQQENLNPPQGQLFNNPNQVKQQDQQMTNPQMNTPNMQIENTSSHQFNQPNQANLMQQFRQQQPLSSQRSSSSTGFTNSQMFIQQKTQQQQLQQNEIMRQKSQNQYSSLGPPSQSNNNSQSPSLMQHQQDIPFQRASNQISQNTPIFQNQQNIDQNNLQVSQNYRLIQQDNIQQNQQSIQLQNNSSSSSMQQQPFNIIQSKQGGFNNKSQADLSIQNRVNNPQPQGTDITQAINLYNLQTPNQFNNQLMQSQRRQQNPSVQQQPFKQQGEENLRNPDNQMQPMLNRSFSANNIPIQYNQQQKLQQPQNMQEQFNQLQNQPQSQQFQQPQQQQQIHYPYSMQQGQMQLPMAAHQQNNNFQEQPQNIMKNQNAFNYDESYNNDPNILSQIFKEEYQKSQISTLHKELSKIFLDQYTKELGRHYTKIQPGSVLGIINITIIHYESKGKNNSVKLEGYSFEDHQKYYNIQNNEKQMFKLNELMLNDLPTMTKQIILQTPLIQAKQLEQQQAIYQQGYSNQNMPIGSGQSHSRILSSIRVDQTKQLTTENQILQKQQLTSNLSRHISETTTDYYFAAQVPGEDYYQNYLYLITMNSNSVQKRTPQQIDIKINIKTFQATQENGYISPQPEQIRGIQVSSCGNIFFLLLKENNSSNFHILCCKKSEEILATKCIKFDKYTKYRNKAELYQYIKEQLSSPKFESLDKAQQDEEKKMLQMQIEREIQEFDKSFVTNGLSMLVDEQFIYFLSPKISPIQSKTEDINQYKSKESDKVQRIDSHHIFLSFRSSQRDLEIIPQKTEWFNTYQQHNIKAVQSSKYIILFLDEIKISKDQNMGNEEIIYELKYKYIDKVNKQTPKQINESEQVYTLKFTSNVDISQIKSIHKIIGNQKDDKFDLTFLLFGKINSLLDQKRSITFKIPDFKIQDEEIKQVIIRDQDINRISSAYIFIQIQQPISNNYYIYDHMGGGTYNIMQENIQNDNSQQINTSNNNGQSNNPSKMQIE